MTFVRRFFSQNLKDAALQLVGMVLSLWALPSLHIMLRVVRERQALKPDTYPQMTDLFLSVLWALLFALVQHFSRKVVFGRNRGRWGGSKHICKLPMSAM